MYNINSKKNGREIRFAASDLIPKKFWHDNGALRHLLKAKAEACAIESAEIQGDSLVVVCHEKLRTNEKGADGKRIWISGDDPQIVNKFIALMLAVNWE
jgi:hypothetical protein